MDGVEEESQGLALGVWVRGRVGGRNVAIWSLRTQCM